MHRPYLLRACRNRRRREHRCPIIQFNVRLIVVYIHITAIFHWRDLLAVIFAILSVAVVAIITGITVIALIRIAVVVILAVVYHTRPLALALLLPLLRPFSFCCGPLLAGSVFVV